VPIDQAPSEEPGAQDQQPFPLEQEQGQQAQRQQPQMQQPQAQEQAREQPMQQRPSQQGQVEPEQRAQAEHEVPLIEGTVQGTVREVDLARGSVTIESEGQQADLQAHPSDLAQLREGEEIQLSFTTYPDGSRWLEQQVDAGELLQRSQSVGQIAGEVDAVDEDAGIVAVAGETFRAHPHQLEQLHRGESVSLSYAEIEGTPWVAEVEPGATGGMQQQQQATAQPQGPRPLDEQHTDSDIDWYFENAG
jgi:hypothetical protein